MVNLHELLSVGCLIQIAFIGGLTDSDRSGAVVSSWPAHFFHEDYHENTCISTNSSSSADSRRVFVCKWRICS